MTLRILRIIAFAAAGAAGAGSAAAEPQKLVLSAAKNDPALIFAQTLCALVNAQQKRLNLACEAKESGSGVESLQSLDGEDVHVAFARADWVQQAIAGTGPFRDKGPVRGSGRQRLGGPNEDIRALFGLQIEAFAVLTRADAGIKSLADVKGKRVNLGPTGSGPRKVYETLAPAMGWHYRDFAVAAELAPADQTSALCRGRVDAVFLLGAQPDSAMKAAAAACDIAFVPVAGREVDALEKDHPALLRTVIPGGIYKPAPRESPTIGMAVTAVATTKLDPRVAYEIAKLVFDNLARLQRADPVFARLDPRRMTGDGLVAPLHDGAARLYKERGLVR